MKLIRRKQTTKIAMNASTTGWPSWSHFGRSHSDAIAIGIILFQRNALILVGELVILPHRVARPVLREQDAAQVGMVLVLDPVHVIGLALVPVRRLVERDE